MSSATGLECINLKFLLIFSDNAKYVVKHFLPKSTIDLSIFILIKWREKPGKKHNIHYFMSYVYPMCILLNPMLISCVYPKDFCFLKR